MGCATLEAFVGLVNSMGLEEEPLSHGQKCMINALSLMTGEHLVCVNWPHPTSLAELLARPVIPALLPLLQRDQLEVIRQWNRPFAVAPFPVEVRTIDSHFHVTPCAWWPVVPEWSTFSRGMGPGWTSSFAV